MADRNEVNTGLRVRVLKDSTGKRWLELSPTGPGKPPFLLSEDEARDLGHMILEEFE